MNETVSSLNHQLLQYGGSLGLVVHEKPRLLILFMSTILENKSSLIASRANLIDSRVKTFRENYSQSLRRTQTKSNLHTLASTVYSQKHNKAFSASKRPSSQLNPEKPSSSAALKGLDMRASHIPNMSEINTSLLMEKRNLEERIVMLKEQIAKETRLRNRTETTWKTHRNNQQCTMQSYIEQLNKSARLNDAITQTKNQNQQLKADVLRLQHERQEINTQKMQQTRNVEEMKNRVNALRNNLIMEEKARNNVKGELVRAQRVMDSCSIENKELENERAMVLLEINETVLINKL